MRDHPRAQNQGSLNQGGREGEKKKTEPQVISIIMGTIRTQGSLIKRVYMRQAGGNVKCMEAGN